MGLRFSQNEKGILILRHVAGDGKGRGI